MARLESKIDLMHVPTPLCVVERLRSLLRIPHGTVALDPCCGDGSALYNLAPDGQLYGVELELERASAAQTRLGHVITGAMQDARLSNNSAGLLLLNPPYDDSTEGRLERVFLDRCTKYLCTGGILVLIIKEADYRTVAQPLRRQYDIIGHWRFPEGWYDGPELAFGQTVLVARRRGIVSSVEKTEDADQFWNETLRLDGSITELPEEFEERVDVPLGTPFKVFISGALCEEDLAALLMESPVSRTLRVPSSIGCGRPPLPLKQGHIALVLASGVINGPYGEGDTHHLAKGTVVRTTTVDQEHDRTAGGNPVLIEKRTESFAIKIRALLPDGEIKNLMGEAMEVNGESEEAEAA
jgi:hypothetical protein